MTFLKAPSVFRTQQRPNKNEYESSNTIFVQQTVFKIELTFQILQLPLLPPNTDFFGKIVKFVVHQVSPSVVI